MSGLRGPQYDATAPEVSLAERIADRLPHYAFAYTRAGNLDVIRRVLKELDAIRPYIEPRPAPAEAVWRPIQSAPKDGTWVLVACAEPQGDLILGSWPPVQPAQWVRYTDGESIWNVPFVDQWMTDDRLVAWTPLPEPPPPMGVSPLAEASPMTARKLKKPPGAAGGEG